MNQVSSKEKVPKEMLEKYTSIVELTDSFSQKYLNEEYSQLIRNTVAALCRKRPSPVSKGKINSWACGATHAIGMVNFLFDPSQSPHVSAPEIYDAFGVRHSTGQGKSKIIRDLLKMYQMDLNWSLPSRLDQNPMVWMVSVNGMISDIRRMPKEVQELAFKKGVIPYIPSNKDIS